MDSVLDTASTVTQFGCNNTPNNAIDRTTEKYSCDRTGRLAEPTGIEVVPSHGKVSIVKGLRLYSHNNCASCDAVDYILEGRTDTSSPWTVIGEGDLPWKDQPMDRNSRGLSISSTYESGDPDREFTQVFFPSNLEAFLEYKLTFPTTRLAGSTSFQFAEVELPGMQFDEVPDLSLSPTVSPVPNPTSSPMEREPVNTVTPRGSSVTSFGCDNSRANSLARIIDETTEKYWCEVIAGQLSGIVIVPNHGRMSIVKGLRIYAHNNCPSCDVVSYILEGRTDPSSPWTVIDEGYLPWKDQSLGRNSRGQTVSSTFESGDPDLNYTLVPLLSNSMAFLEYKLSFPESRAPGVNYQFSEIELPGFLF